MEFYQLGVVANLPPTSGASAVHGRFRYRIERIDSREGQISLSLSVRTVTLASHGDFARSMNDTEIALIDPATGEHTVPGGSGGNSQARRGMLVMTRNIRADDCPTCKEVSAQEDFLKGARAYSIGRNCGCTLTLPHAIPEMMLDEKR